MTKNELLAIARDVKMMDQLNTISGLMEMNEKLHDDFISSLVDDIYKKLKSLEVEHKTPTKSEMLHYIMDYDYDLYSKIKYKRHAEIRLVYLKLTSSNK